MGTLKITPKIHSLLRLWNSLPSSARNTSLSVASFCGQLKTEPFIKAYSANRDSLLV